MAARKHKTEATDDAVEAQEVEKTTDAQELPHEDVTAPAAIPDDLVAVRIVQETADGIVVEWQSSAGKLCRGWIGAAPAALVSEGVLNALTPYGDLKDAITDIHWKQSQIVEELHQMGVWFRNELRADPLSKVLNVMGVHEALRITRALQGRD